MYDNFLYILIILGVRRISTQGICLDNMMDVISESQYCVNQLDETEVNKNSSNRAPGLDGRSSPSPRMQVKPSLLPKFRLPRPDIVISLLPVFLPPSVDTCYASM